MKSLRSGAAFLLFLIPFARVSIFAQTPVAPPVDALLRAFVDPPNSAQPRVWWHWMDGNISLEGIKLDLDWMHRIGLGGVTIFEGAIDTPQIVPHRLVYMTPEWKQAFKYAVSYARGLDMEVAIASSPGWSETGGPWVPPPQAMKKMVWSATRITGGQPFTEKLLHPPQVDGVFQNLGIPGSSGVDGKMIVRPEFYADAAVVAYKIPDGDKAQRQLNPQVTSNVGPVNVPALSDGDVETVAAVLPPSKPDKEEWIQFDYGHPQQIQAVTLASLGDEISVFDFESDSLTPSLQASEDDVHFSKVADIPNSSVIQRTVAFGPVTAQYFRVIFPAQLAGIPARSHCITELILTSGARVNEWEKHAGFANARNYYAIAEPNVAPQFIVPESDVIDLTGKMSSDGTLDWTPPPGEWMVLRIGYSLTGHENGPAPAEATGLEVDKLNRAFVRNYIDGYLKMYADVVGPRMIGKEGISYLLTDSIEVGPQNWTDDMLSEFRKRRGYDPHPWLPALTGIIIKSTTDTGRFLWDFRRTIAQLIAENHYGEISDEVHMHGMNYYGEALEFHRPSLGDDMEMRSKMDIPMGAMWTFPKDGTPQSSYLVDLRGAASIAHIYGQSLVGAESMTSAGPAWSWYPGNLKMIADLQLALGVNRFMIHESTHQPLPDRGPGLTLGIAGQFFTRNETWAEEAGPWIKYLARSSYLLQQGRYFGDVAYFYGEEGPLTAVFGWQPQTDAPEGYGFDFVNSDVVLNHLSFENGRLTTRGGTSYRILYLGGNSKRMTLPVLRRFEELVAQGAVIAGDKPIDSPSLSDDQAEFRRIADRLWGAGESNQAFMHRFGKGAVYAGRTANEVLAALKVTPDFQYTKPEPDTRLMFLHRKLADGEIYFVDNRNDHAENLDATFRLEGKEAELWDAATGLSKPASYRIADGRTTVPLQLDPFGAIFVVFRTPATAQARQLPKPLETVVSSIQDSLDRDWTVHFQGGRGAPEIVPFDGLSSWSENTSEGVKYFSGTATYTKTIDAPAAWFSPGAHLWLDLGEVKNIAEVAVNEKEIGVLWKLPYKVDLTGCLLPGKNLLTIKVTNLWVNRLIGDEQPASAWKYTFTDIQPYTANSTLISSGLLGPLEFISVTEGR